MAKKDKSSKPKQKKAEKQPDDLLHKQWHHIPVVLIGLVGVAIIVASVAGLILSFNTDTDTEQATESITTDSIHSESGLSYAQKAFSLSNLESSDKAVEFLEDSAEQASDNPEAQSEFYSEAVIILLNDSQPEKALELAEKAYELNPAYETASLAVTVAEILGDVDLELKYLRLALDGIPEEQAIANPDGSGYNYVSERIRFLEEQ